jgi:DNA-binding GntR family transcriptional regulator
VVYVDIQNLFHNFKYKFFNMKHYLLLTSLNFNYIIKANDEQHATELIDSDSEELKEEIANEMNLTNHQDAVGYTKDDVTVVHMREMTDEEVVQLEVDRKENDRIAQIATEKLKEQGLM